jgi:hypothetical protein
VRIAEAWGKITPRIAACVVFTVGCQNRATVATCGDLMVRENVITPYGIIITDCDRAEALAREVAQGREVLVYFDGCVLVESGPAAWFACEEHKRGKPWSAGELVGPGGIPLRDEERRIPASIWVRGDGGALIDYQLVLVNGGAARHSDDSAG